MSLYEPPRVRVADMAAPEVGMTALVGALGIPWLMCLGALYFVTPVLAESIAISLFSDQPAAALSAVDGPMLRTMLMADLAFDMLFVALGTWWAIQLSRLAPVAVAVLFALALVAVRTVEAGGLPGVINTGFPVWYDWAGNVNDLIGALSAALIHGVVQHPDHAT